MKNLTLEEIGKLAGVSRATVSRVVNGYPYIRPEVRKRVEKVIAETGYRPNLIARSLASDRSNIIGLVIPNQATAVFTDPYFPRLIQGITQAASQNKLTLALFLFHSREEEDITIESIVNTSLVDGLIITADRKVDPIAQALLKRHMPFVQLGRPELRPKTINFVDVDNVAGGKMATDHFISLGYQRIAIIASDQNTAGDDRLNGYYAALQAHGRPIDDHLVAYGDFSIKSAAQAMNRLLPHQPDAVFVCSDSMALGALMAIREAGLSVPEDIAVIGYDDLPPAVQSTPPLSTIRQPVFETGQLAVNTLVDVLDKKPKSATSHILSNQLVIRHSCGAAHMGLLDNYVAENIVLDV
jgi:LacI family transcriptional regulator